MSERLRQASRFSEDMKHNESSDYDFSQTHRSEQGDARISVSRRVEQNDRNVGQKKLCFVATACFGDIDHPVVSDLRRFRDETLKNWHWGRIFTGWYYRNGEVLAEIVTYLPGARRTLRPLLWLIARFFIISRKRDASAQSSEVTP